jgi:Lar family restriction alleviation protein
MTDTTMNTGAASLLPCPFCGSAARLQPAFGNDLWWVACATCDFETNPQKTREATVAAWNRRATTPQADAAPSGMHVAALLAARDWLTDSNSPHALRNQIDSAIAAGGAQEQEQEQEPSKQQMERDFKTAFKGASYAPFEILSMFEAWQECVKFYGFATPEHSAIYISKRLTGSEKDAAFVQAHINQAVSEAVEAISREATAVRISDLKDAGNIARLFDLGTPDGHAIADEIGKLTAGPAASNGEQ